jgi:hypothetical protein
VRCDIGMLGISRRLGKKQTEGVVSGWGKWSAFFGHFLQPETNTLFAVVPYRLCATCLCGP